jgi:6-phosphogluconolactonase (cycloisomerase 2 family)
MVEGALVVTEAVGGAVGMGSVSSYLIGPDGSLEVVATSVPNGQTATCWITVTDANNLVITSNTDSDTNSTYTIGFDGSMALLNGVAGAPGDGPTDMSLAPGDLHLYQLLGGTGEIAVFEVDDIAGTLSLVDTSTGLGLPTLGSQGIVAWGDPL